MCWSAGDDDADAPAGALVLVVPAGEGVVPAADAGQVAPDARENVAPNNVDNNGVNTGSGGTMLHPDGSSMNNDGMTKDEEHKNTMCKDGRCPDINKKVQTGDGINNDVDTKTDGTTQ